MKRIFAVALAILCVTALLGAGATYASNQPSGNVVYEYALLGDVYTPEAGLISATAPNGATISSDIQELVLNWAQDSYIFEYEGKTVNLKVYESAPSDILTVNSKMIGTASQGLKTRFPGFTAISGIHRTDGAPEIGAYAVSAVFWLDGRQVQVVRDATKDFDFTPTESGLWMVSYQYTDVFGRVRSKNYPFTVTSDRIIVSQVEELYYIGNTVGSGNAYGYYNGKQYPVAMELQCPDGTTVSVGERYVFSQEGVYTLTASVEMEGQTVTRSHSLEVKSGLQSFLTDIEGFADGVVQSSHENIDTVGGTDQGLLLDMTASAAGFTYNGVVDLNKLGKDTPIISFSTNHSYGGSISKVSVTLTDVYDPNNSVSVIFKRNSDMTATAMSYDNTAVNATFGNTSVAVNNYYPLNESSVGWSTSFHSYWLSPEYENPKKTYKVSDGIQAMNFAFDMDTNTVYSYGNYYLVEWEGKSTPRDYPTERACRWFPIADLDHDNLLNKFGGFTTGEVYVELSVLEGRGDILLYSIGGVNTETLAEGYMNNAGILLGELDSSLPAAVGVEYPLPDGDSSFVEELTQTVTTGTTPIECTANGFVPSQTGSYTVTYEGINQFGNPISKEVTISSIEKPELTVSYATKTVKIGEIYTIAEPILTGYGKLSSVITLNGEEVKPGQKVLVQETMEISVTAKDALDTVEKSFHLNVDRDAVEFRVDFPRSAVCDSNFQFPKAEIYDYLSGTALEYEIYVNGVKQGEEMTLPATPGTVRVEYRTSRGNKAYTLYVRAAETQSGAEALILPTGAVAQGNEAGTVVTVKATNPVVQLPYKLSATSLPFQFIVLQEQLNFNAMNIRLTDGAGTSITATVVGLMEDEPHLYVNGQDTLVKLNKQILTFSSGEYEGKRYYAYTMEYHDMHRAMMNASRIETNVTTDENGVVFHGFQGGVYLDIYPGELRANTASFLITQVGNQYFYNSAFAYGDIVAPALHTPDFFIGNNYVNSGYVLRLSNLKAYDVLQAEATVEVTLMLADESIHCQNADPATVSDAVLEKPGVYVLKVKAEDAAGATLDTTYLFTVEDDKAPEISLSGNMAQTAKAGGKLVLPGATAADDSACTVRMTVFDSTGRITIYGGTENTIQETTLQGLRQGSYLIYYIATDETGNVSTQAYTVTVEG